MCVSKSFNSTALIHAKLKMCVYVCVCVWGGGVKAGSATACGGTAGVGSS